MEGHSVHYPQMPYQFGLWREPKQLNSLFDKTLFDRKMGRPIVCSERQGS